jgi:VWFA-related protein
VIRRPVVAGLSICGLLLARALSAQSQNPSSPQSTFTSNSELVLVPVQVMDHRGQPLRGLNKAAFVLESDGQPQQIAVFDEVRRSTQVMVPEHKAKPATVPTNFSNLRPDGIPHELVILAIDRLNTIGYLQKWARDQLIAYIRAHPPQEPTALVMIAPDGLLEFQGPTWDGEALIQALQRMRFQGDMFRPELTPDLRTSFHGRSGEYAMMMASLTQDRQALLAQSQLAIQNTLHSFEEIAKAYSAVPGRKTVMWFTTGFPALDLEPDEPPLFSAPSHETALTRLLFGDPRGPYETPVTSLRHMGKELAPEFQRAFAALNRANVVLYPVDLAAFSEDRLWTVWSGGPCLGTWMPTAGSVFGTSCAADPSGSWLHRIGEKVVARSTGGEPCDAGNHVEHCVEKAEAESNGYYLLGFYVPQQSRKEGWHELRVQVSSDHGLVRTRSGYYLEANRPAPNEQDTHSIDDAVVAALEYTGVIFSIEPGKRDNAGVTVPFKLSVAGGSIMTMAGEDKLSFDVVSVPISAHGLPIPGAGRISKVNMDRAAMEKALAHGWKLIDEANAPKTAIAVKVVVRDNITGRVGSVVFPLAEEAARTDWRAPKNGAVVSLGGSAERGSVAASK